MLLYAHAYPSTGDPHELVVDLPFDERDGIFFGPEWMEVMDATGKRYELRSYPCGAGCHCAAQLREVQD